MSCHKPVTNLCTPLNDSVSFNCSTFYQCCATAFLSVSHHQSSFVPLKQVVHFSFTLLTLRFAAASMAFMAIVLNLFPYIMLCFVFVCANTLCLQYRLIFFKRFSYYHNFLRRKVSFAFPAAAFNYSYLCQLLIDTGDFKQRIFHNHFATATGQKMVKIFLGKTGQTC